jgi:hypothetical protein
MRGGLETFAYSQLILAGWLRLRRAKPFDGGFREPVFPSADQFPEGRRVAEVAQHCRGLMGGQFFGGVVAGG